VSQLRLRIDVVPDNYNTKCVRVGTVTIKLLYRFNHIQNMFFYETSTDEYKNIIAPHFDQDIQKSVE